MLSSTRDGIQLQILEHLRARGSLSVIDLGLGLCPESFVGEDLAPRQALLEKLRAQCATLVEAKVLTAEYSPTNGDLVFDLRQTTATAAPKLGMAERSVGAAIAEPAVFRQRGSSDWPSGLPRSPDQADTIFAMSGRASDYAVFFKLGTVLRPNCEAALRDLARTAAKAMQIHVVGQTAHGSGTAELSGMLASQRAAVVANRLVDCGIDRFRIELSIQRWDELPLAPGVLAVDPPRGLPAQARRVDIKLRYE